MKGAARPTGSGRSGSWVQSAGVKAKAELARKRVEKRCTVEVQRWLQGVSGGLLRVSLFDAGGGTSLEVVCVFC